MCDVAAGNVDVASDVMCNVAAGDVDVASEMCEFGAANVGIALATINIEF